MSLMPLAMMAIAPGIALLAYFYLKDQYIAEPFSLVFRVFMIGVLLVFPVMIIQRGLYLWLTPPEWAQAFFLSGGIEEFFKWFAILYYMFNHREFDEPYDGIVYTTSLSLGFATMENIIYVFAYQLRPFDLFLRALLPVSGHALFGVMMGFWFGKAKFSPESTRKYVAVALFLPVLWHGMFDFLLTDSVQVWVWLIIPLMAALWFRGIRKVHIANARSPYRMLRHDDMPHSS